MIISVSSIHFAAFNQRVGIFAVKRLGNLLNEIILACYQDPDSYIHLSSDIATIFARKLALTASRSSA